MSDRVARIELWHFVAPLPATFRPSWIPGFPQNENRATLLRVITEDGVEGWTAGPAIGREREGLGELIGPYLLGEDATDIGVIQQRLREIGYLGWRNWWIEPAFWDIKGKIAGQPVFKLLDPDSGAEAVTTYASSGEVRSGKARIAEAEARYDEGFRTFKLRVHEDEKADEQQVVQTARAVGDKMTLGVDANQAWRVTAVADAPKWNLERAKRFADVCADVGVAWLEEPLPMDAYDDLADLARYSRVATAGGELHTSAYAELAMMVRRGCYLIFQPDAIFTGGIAQTWQLIQLCKAQGLEYTPHTWTNGLGFAVNLQLYVASGTERPLEYPYDPPGWVPEARDAMLEQPFAHYHGRVNVPTGPGLGVEISQRALKKYGKRFFKMDRKRLALWAVKDRGVKAAREMDKAKRARLKN
jgi:L-alanine-DL-glutamate epimerase-like enolase superfamily enzyme